MGKINKSELQEMLKAGKTQTYCAKYFQVSEAAICNAVKRLKAMELPDSLQKLTTKERDFVLHVAEGDNPTQSALKAFDCNYDSGKTIASRMMKDEDIKLAINDLLAQEGLSRRRRIQRLKDVIESNDLSAVTRGLDMSFKIGGEYAPERIEVDVDIKQLSMSWSEALQMVRDQGRLIDAENEA